jgi:hypothetical protein
LALALGKTRKQLLQQLDSDELADWEALEDEDPWGQLRDDWRIAKLTAEIVNAVGGSADGEIYTPKHGLLAFVREQQSAPPPAPPTPEQLAAHKAKLVERQLESWISGHNAIVREKGVRHGRRSGPRHSAR